jgi:integrase
MLSKICCTLLHNCYYSCMGTHQLGRIYEASGKFYVQYRVVVNGKRVQRSHFLCVKGPKRYRSETDPSVKRLRDEHMLGVNAQQAEQSPNRDMRVVDFWEQVYLPYCEEIVQLTGKPRKTPSTVRGYKQIWRQHLKSHFGNLTLQEYSPPMGTAFLDSLTSGQGKATLRHIKACATSLFKRAVNKQRIKVNPWHDVQMPDDAVESAPTLHYTVEEAEDIVSALVDRVDCQLIMSLACFLGLRPGEIAALRWEDFDEENVHIRRSVVRGIVGTPKTKESIASLPLIDRVRIPLELWRRKSPDTSGWVFPSVNNTPIDLHNLVARIIRPALEAKELVWKGMYAGRRGAGTAIIALTNGNAAVGQALLRHKNMSTTLTFYKKQIPAADLRAGVKLLEAEVAK